MADTQTILSFEQNVSFLRRRAEQCRKEGRYKDALILFRRLITASPESHPFLPDAVDMLCDISRPDQALRELGFVFAQNPANPNGMYLLARCLLLMGCFEGAQEALAIRLSSPCKDDLYDQATDALCRLRLFEPYAAHRRETRAVHIARKSYDALLRGTFSSAFQWAEKGLSICPGVGITILHRLSKACMRPTIPASVRTAHKYAADEALDDFIRLIAVGILPAQSDEKRLLLRKLALQISDSASVPLLISAASQLAPHIQTDLFASLLNRFPYDRNLLHALAVCTLRAGGKTAEALACWRRMLIVDPGDPVAFGCLALFEAESSDPYALALLPILTHPLNRILRIRFKRIETYPASEQWPLLRWAYMQPDCAYTACRLTKALFPCDAEAILRANMLDPHLPSAARMLSLDALKDASAQSPFLLFSENTLTFYDSPISAPSTRLPLFLTRALKYALQVVCRYDLDLAESLTGRWFRISEMPSISFRFMAHPRAMAAALSIQTLNEIGRMPSVKKVAARFGCTPRRVNYCLKILQHYTREDETAHDTN